MSLTEKAKEKMLEGKKPVKYVDPRFAGKRVNKARQQQRREYVLNNMMRRAQSKKDMGMSLYPEEEWVLGNKGLFL